MKIWNSSRGAIDLASIMVGVIVTALLTGGSAVVFLGLIPWMQDNSAQSSLSTLSIAQSSSMQAYDKYSTTAELVNLGVLQASSDYCTQPVGDTYISYARGGSGRIFTVTGTDTPTLFTGDVAATCL